MHFKTKYLFILAALILVYACVKKKTYSLSPEIEFKGFIPYQGDSADMVITFSDGNGDIGNASGDTIRNLYMNYYYKDSITNKFVAYYSATFNDSVKTGYIIRKPTEADYQDKSISGEVSVHIPKYRHSKKVKNLKYVIYMFDNAGNKSNTVTTPELFVP